MPEFLSTFLLFWASHSSRGVGMIAGNSSIIVLNFTNAGLMLVFHKVLIKLNFQGRRGAAVSRSLVDYICLAYLFRWLFNFLPVGEF